MRQNIFFKTRERKDCLQMVSVIGSLVRILCWVSSSAVTIAITLSLAVALAYGWYYSQCAQNIALKTTCPCCSDCAGWGKRSLLGKQCLRAVSLHWIWQEKINRTSLWRKEARAADGDDDKKAENCSTHLCVSLTIKATSQLNDSPTQLKNIKSPNFDTSMYPYWQLIN